jgi:hypothetical protein
MAATTNKSKVVFLFGKIKVTAFLTAFFETFEGIVDPL